MRLVGLALALTASVACIGDPPERELTAAQRAQLDRHATAQPPSLMIRHEASFGGTATAPDVELAGYLLEPRTLTQIAGSTFTITLVWKVHRALDPGLRVFTHLVGGDGQMLLNLDASGPLRAEPGRAGAPFPPATWPVGRYVRDTVTVALPSAVTPKIRLLVGLYQGRNRLSAHGDGTDPRHAAAVLPLATRAPAANGVQARGSAPTGRSPTGRSPTGRRAAVPELNVPRLRPGHAVHIDGILDEEVWKHAARTGSFVSPATGALAPDAPVQGSARILYDERSFYIAFEVGDRDVRGGFDERSADPHLWTRDTVEIMLDPDGDGDNEDYYEIQIGPQNLVFDSRFDAYNEPRGGPKGPFGHQHWSATAKSEVAIDGTIDDNSDVDGGYVVEARIPFSAFDKAKRSPPAVGDRWRANFYAMQNNGGVAWSPILGQGNFHRASRFGRLIWSDALVP